MAEYVFSNKQYYNICMDFHYAQLAKYKTIEEILRDQRKTLKIGN